jgi:hypothetical protein
MVLLGKRPSSKTIEPGKWEFGCAQLKRRMDFDEAAKQAYIGDFGIEIAELSVAPLGRYYIGAKGVPGIVFAGRVVKKKPNLQRIPQKHSEAKWSTPDDVYKMRDDELVPNAKERVKAAQEWWKQHWSE